MKRMRALLHHVIIHPLAGALWFIGAEKAGEWMHSSVDDPWATATHEAESVVVS